MKLVIGNKNYSSWSLRPWLLLHGNGIQFFEVNESLSQHCIRERLGKYSESCKVPVLVEDNITIWDSLAICEYVSEAYLGGRGWPRGLDQRSHARSICSEMHSGFAFLRNELPMNCRLETKLDISKGAQRDVERIDSIWSDFASEDGDGNLRLFGEFGIADCFFAPVVLRFRSYGIQISEAAQAYSDSLIEHPSIVSWTVSASHETEVVPEDEIQI